MVMRSQDWRFQKLQEAEAWEASRIFNTVSDGSSRDVFVDIPANGPELSVEDILVSTEGKLEIARFKNVTEDTQGDAMLVANKRISSTATVPFDFRTGGDNETGAYSGGVKEEENLISGAVSGNKVGGGTEARPALIASTGSNYLIRFGNESGQTISFSVQFEFAEIEE